jgi:hypothetical protein
LDHIGGANIRRLNHEMWHVLTGGQPRHRCPSAVLVA